LKIASLKGFKTLPLHARITVIVGLVLTIALIIFIFIARSFFIQTTKSQVELRAQTLVDYLTQTSVSALVNYDQTMLHQYCTAIAHQRDVIFAMVIDQNGKIIAIARNPNSVHTVSNTELPLKYLKRGTGPVEYAGGRVANNHLNHRGYPAGDAAFDFPH